MSTSTSVRAKSAALGCLQIAFLFAALIPATVLSCGAGRKGESLADVRMYPAVRLRPDARSAAQKELGCDPCDQTVSVDRFGNLVPFVFNRDSVMHLRSQDIVSASILPSLRGGQVVFLLILYLSDSGRQRIAGYIAEHPEEITVNEVGGRLAGANPLMITHDQFIAGRFLEEEEVKAAVAQLGVAVRMEGLVIEGDEQRM